MKKVIKKSLPILIIILCIALITSLIHYYKPLPQGISYNGEYHNVEHIEFLTDVTYETHAGKTQKEQVIFDRIYRTIDEAEDFIIIDMFLFNDEYNSEYDFPSLSMELTNKIVEKKQSNPDIKIYFITDKINTFYGSYSTEQLDKLKENNIEVIMTDLTKLRDSNPIYSGFWRSYIQWFGTDGKTWLPNPFGDKSPNVTLRSYLSLLNFKANHRKVVISEKEAIVSSANPHDASANHSNIAFVVKGNIIGDLVKSEKAVAKFSGKEINVNYNPSKSKNISDDLKVKLITEGQIKKELINAINKTQESEDIKIGMFYFSDRDVIHALKKASHRGVNIQLILDPNKDAFGMEKNGIPNRQVASELVNDSSVKVRWYDTDGEQFHTKITIIQSQNKTTVIGGSANLTKRNIGDFNLETNLMIVSNNDHIFAKEVVQYFDNLWNNKDGFYTLDYSEYQDDSLLKKIIYLFQEKTGLSTF